MKIHPRRALIGLAVAASLVAAPPAAASAADAAGSTIETRANGAPSQRAASAELRSVAFLQEVSSDQEFLTTAASGSATEIAAGRLAQERGSSSEVRGFGERLVQDHQEALQSATNIARSKGFGVPQAPATAEQAALIADLTARTGQDFDRAFVRAMTREHETAIDEFEAARVSLSTDVNSFAARFLPGLRDHLDTAEDLAARVGA